MRDAFAIAGIVDPSIPDWIAMEEIPVICEKHSLEWTGKGNLKIGVEPVIVLYRTRKNKAHAVFVNDIGSLLNQEIIIVGVIRLKIMSN